MKKLLIPFMFLLSFNCMSQVLKTNQSLIIFNGEYKICYNGEMFDVDTTILTIKPVDIDAIILFSHHIKFSFYENKNPYFI
jgi:hypothetical protein